MVEEAAACNKRQRRRQVVILPPLRKLHPASWLHPCFLENLLHGSVLFHLKGHGIHAIRQLAMLFGCAYMAYIWTRVVLCVLSMYRFPRLSPLKVAFHC